MTKEIFSEALLSLEKISRTIGEDEDQNIVLLKTQYHIIISDEIGPPNSGNSISIWVVETNKNGGFLSLIRDRNYNTNFLQKIIIEREEFMKFTISIEFSHVYYNIIEDLKEDHGIQDEDLTEKEWEKLQETDLWKKCELQVAREIIASDLVEKFNNM